MKNLLIGLVFIAFLGGCNNPRKANTETVVATPDTVITVLHVAGMTCNHCEMSVKSGVSELPGIIEVNASFTDSTAYVKYDASLVNMEDITAAIAKKGYQVEGIKE